MAYTIAGLGNPGEEYRETRHNAGRMMLEYIAKKNSFPEFKENIKIKALVTKGDIEITKKGIKKSEKLELVAPNNFMNRSGASVGGLFGTPASPAKLKKFIVIYDDLDLPLGTIKISYNRSSGGHRGLESIIKAVKSQEFLRIRIGICPTTPAGKLKKPSGESEVEKHIIGPFKKPEFEILEDVKKKVAEAVVTIIADGKDVAMGKFN